MLLDRVAKAMGVPLVSLFEDTPAQTTTGMEGLLVRLLGELVRLRRSRKFGVMISRALPMRPRPSSTPTRRR